MAKRKLVKTGMQTSAKRTAVIAKSSKGKGFTEYEKGAMRDRIRELQASGDKSEGEAAVLTKIAELPASDRAIAERIHAVIKASAPELSPKLWYGMPAYARDGKNVCFFQSAQKFKSRYATLGFNDPANLDEGLMWPVAFALKKVTAAEEERIAALVRKAVS